MERIMINGIVITEVKGRKIEEVGPVYHSVNDDWVYRIQIECDRLIPPGIFDWFNFPDEKSAEKSRDKLIKFIGELK